MPVVVGDDAADDDVGGFVSRQPIGSVPLQIPAHRRRHGVTEPRLQGLVEKGLHLDAFVAREHPVAGAEPVAGATGQEKGQQGGAGREKKSHGAI